MSATYYSPSGKFPGVAIPVTFIGGCIASLIIAAAYAYAILYIPIAGTVTFLLTGGAAFGLGTVLTLLLNKTKVRNTAVAAAVSLAVALVFFYFAWSTWLFALMRRGDEPSDISWVALTLSPMAVWDLVNEVNRVGAWNLKGSTPTGGLLWFLWAIEAAILIGLPTFIGLTVTSSPFCETADEWLEEQKAVLIGAGTPEEVVKQKAEMSDFASLFVPVTDPADIISLSIWSTPRSELHTVVINAIKTTVKNNKTETDSKALVSHLVISRAQLEGLRQLSQKQSASVTVANPDA